MFNTVQSNSQSPHYPYPAELETRTSWIKRSCTVKPKSKNPVCVLLRRGVEHGVLFSFL